MSRQANKNLVRSFFREGYNNHNYSAVHECLAPNYKDRGDAGAMSAEEAVEILKNTQKAFPDIEVVIDDLIEEGDLVAFRGRFSGTHSAEFLGVAASGKRVEFEALEIFRVEDGKIVESWGYWPNEEILRQMQE